MAKPSFEKHLRRIVSMQLKPRKRGLVYVFTGEGAGKTTAALGHALRALGHGKKVVVVQFLKGRKSVGEYKAQEKLGALYEVRQFGRVPFVDLKHPSKEDVRLANAALDFAEKAALKKKPFLLILDEVNLAMAFGLVSTKRVLAFLRRVPWGVNVFLTGRRAPKAILDFADGATEMRLIRHPFERGVPAIEGIEF
jgi:cob(I)alamin adenosyltransferase